MSVAIALLCSLVLAICSTAIVRPWFLKNALKKAKNHESRILTSEYDKYSYEYEQGLKSFTRFNVTIAILTFLVSVLVHLCAHTRLTAYGFICSIIIVLSLQILGTYWYWNGLSTKRQTVVSVLLGVGILFCISLLINNAIFSYSEESQQREIRYLSFIDNSKNEKFQPLSSADIAKFCKSSSATYLQQLDNQYVYTLSGGQTGKAVAVLDENGITIYPTKYNGTAISFHLRNKYPYDEIVPIKLEIINGVPFGKFALVSRPYLYGTPTLKEYVRLNMVTGETVSNN